MLPLPSISVRAKDPWFGKKSYNRIEVQLKRITAHFDELIDLENNQECYDDPGTPKGGHREIYQDEYYEPYIPVGIHGEEFSFDKWDKR